MGEATSRQTPKGMQVISPEQGLVVLRETGIVLMPKEPLHALAGLSGIVAGPKHV